MIDLLPYAPELAVEVFKRLDGNDRLEAEAARGECVHFYGLFGDWHSMVRSHIASAVLVKKTPFGQQPFAVAAMANSGVSGVAEAAFLAANHEANRWSLARAAVKFRPFFHDLCLEQGIHRVEARTWGRHPTAPGFLAHMGFSHQCDLPGIGPGGSEMFRLFAITFPTQTQKDQFNV